MGTQTSPPEASPEAVKNAKSNWYVFTKATTYSVIAIIIVLALMALFLL